MLILKFVGTLLEKIALLCLLTNKYHKYTSDHIRSTFILLLMMDLLQRLKNTNRLQMMISNFLLVLGVYACTVFVVELHI